MRTTDAEQITRLELIPFPFFLTFDENAAIKGVIIKSVIYWLF